MNEKEGNWLYGKVPIKDGKIGLYMRNIRLGPPQKEINWFI